jgi:hypothetical protein
MLNCIQGVKDGFVILQGHISVTFVTANVLPCTCPHTWQRAPEESFSVHGDHIMRYVGGKTLHIQLAITQYMLISILLYRLLRILRLACKWLIFGYHTLVCWMSSHDVSKFLPKFLNIYCRLYSAPSGTSVPICSFLLQFLSIKIEQEKSIEVFGSELFIAYRQCIHSLMSALPQDV